MTRAMQDAEDIVAGYLAELLTPVDVAESSAPDVATSEAVPVREPLGAARRRTGDGYLLCIAAGVKLAVPMTDVVHIVPMPPLTAPNTTHPVCLGRWPHPSGEARVADLAAILSPDMAGTAAATLVLLGSRAWALACTVVDEPVWLDATAIQWRHGATTRPWLAGMASEPKCGVVGTAALIEWLEKELGP